MSRNLTFVDFEKEVLSGKIKPVYFISAEGNYFVKKAMELLKGKIFGTNASDESFFLKYADEIKYNELLDLCRNFTSLFAPKKLIVLKRAERFSRNLKFIFDYAASPDADTTLILVFDNNYVNESKLWKDYNSYDFTELPDDYFLKWLKDEFAVKGCIINERELNFFASSVPSNFDIIIQEIDKISNFVSNSKDKIITKEIVLKSIGFAQTYTPEDLMVSILNKDAERCTDITQFLLNKSGISEIYLLSIILNYYADLLCFKTKGFMSLNTYEVYNKYKIWRERVEFSKRFNYKLQPGQFKEIFKNLLETDKKLKTSMIDSKILITSLIEDLIKV